MQKCDTIADCRSAAANHEGSTNRLAIFFLPQTGYQKFINMAKDCWLCQDSISRPLDPQSSALPIRHEQGVAISGVLTE